jgi:hypothetical protein
VAMASRLGHATVAITLDTYSHVLPAADVSVAHTLARLILRGDQPFRRQIVATRGRRVPGTHENRPLGPVLFVGRAGIEPATSCVSSKRSSRLS